MKQLKQHRIWMMFLVFTLLWSTCVLAQSTPLSVSGTIYELDGITQVPAGTTVTIENTVNGYKVSGGTGTFYNSGRYAAVVDGNPGDLVVITASTSTESVSISVPVSGSMHNLDLLLNTTVPNNPPQIISTAPETATSEERYIYDIEAVDLDGDPLTYFLLSGPTGMTMFDPTGGVLWWTPTIGQGGLHNVLIQVNDTEGGSDSQAFTIFVNNSSVIDNIPPIITSEPKTKAFVQRRYVYDVIARDRDKDPLTYALTESPATMKINVTTGKIFWIPTFADVGNHTITVTVTDPDGGFDNQTYILTVIGFNAKIAPAQGYGTQDIYVNQLALPYFVTGTIHQRTGFFSTAEAKAGTPVVIENQRTGEQTQIETGIGPLEGSYAAIIPGKQGDPVQIIVDNDRKKAHEFSLDTHKNEIDLSQSRFRKTYVPKKTTIFNRIQQRFIQSQKARNEARSNK